MKLKFKTQAYQSAAVHAVVDCFKGQPPATLAAQKYKLDPGNAVRKGAQIVRFRDHPSPSFLRVDHLDAPQEPGKIQCGGQSRGTTSND